jgi:hypothetical protein
MLEGSERHGGSISSCGFQLPVSSRTLYYPKILTLYFPKLTNLWKFPQIINRQNRIFMFLGLDTKIMGVHGKPHKSEKHIRLQENKPMNATLSQLRSKARYTSHICSWSWTSNSNLNNSFPSWNHLFSLLRNSFVKFILWVWQLYP